MTHAPPRRPNVWRWWAARPADTSGMTSTVTISDSAAAARTATPPDDGDGARLDLALPVGSIDQAHAQGEAAAETGQDEPEPNTEYHEPQGDGDCEHARCRI